MRNKITVPGSARYYLINNFRLIQCRFLFIINLLVVPFITNAQFHTPVINAAVGTNEYGTSNVNTYVSGSTTWYMTWNNTDLFVNIINANETEPVTIYLDVDPNTPVNGGTDANGTLVGLNYDGYSTRPNLPFRADVAIYCHSGYREIFRRNSSNDWTSLGGTPNGLTGSSNDYNTDANGHYSSNQNGNGAGGDDRREFRVSWSRLLGTINSGNRPSSFNWMGYISYNNGMYAQVPVENYNGNNVTGNSNGILRYFTVSSTADGSSTGPFARNSYTHPLSVTNNSFGAISVWDFTMNSSGQQIARLNTGGDWTINGNLVVGAGTVFFGSGGSGYGNSTVGNVNVLGGSLNMDQTNKTLNVTGNVSIASGATMLLSGTVGGDLEVGGNFTNNGTITPNSRLVTLDGASAQTVSGTLNGSSTTNNFAFLTINNTSGGVSLSNPIVVTSQLALTSGIITSTTTNTISVIATAAGAVTGGSNTSFVNGPLNRSLPANLTGTANIYSFPLGSGSTYLPFTLDDPTTGATGPVLQVTATLASSGGTASSTSLSSISSTEYWQLNVVSGNFTNGGLDITRTAALSGLNTIGRSTTVNGTYASIDGTASGTTINGVANAIGAIASGNSNFFLMAVRLTPSITSLSASSGYRGQSITITGTNFSSDATVSINGVSATISSQSSTSITIVIANTGVAVSSTTIVVTNSSANSSVNNAFAFLGHITTTTGDWNTTGTWLGNALPPAGATIVVDHNITVNASVTNAAGSVTINASDAITFGTSGALTATTVTNNGSIVMTSGGTLTIANGGSITNGAGGTFTRGSGTVTFAGSGTISGTIGFNNVNIAGAVEFGSGSTINGILQINANGFVNSTCPTYASGSTIIYNTGGTFFRGNEWTANNLNLPFNVRVNAGTTLDLDVKKTTEVNNTHYDFEGREMRGDLDIYGILTMGGNNGTMAEDLIVRGNVTIRGTASGVVGRLILGSQKPSDVKIADIQLGLNWVVEEGGVFDASRRAVIFNGTTTTQQTFTSGNAIENFGYFVVNKPTISGVEGTVKMFCNAYIYGQNQGSVLQLLNGSLDLNGKSMTLQVRDSINGVNQSILIDGSAGNETRRVFNSSADTASFNITHYRTNPVDAHIDTIKRNSAFLSTLSFGTKIVVTVGSATGNVGINFGSGITTINGTLRINARGFVDLNPPTYATNSLLQYNIGGNYNRNIEWNAASGPGYPFNVQTSLSGTRLIAGGAVLSGAATNVGVPLNLLGSLTIDAGTFFDMQDQAASSATNEDMTVPLIVALDINLNGRLIASGNSGGNVQLGRNWTRNNIPPQGVFTDNTRRLIFNSAENSIIDLTAAGSETFYIVETAKSASTNTITLNKPVDISNTVYFGIGRVISSLTNLLTFYDGSDADGESDNSFVDGPVAKVGNDPFSFPVGKEIRSIAASIYNPDGLTGGYRPISISAPGSASDVFTAEFFHRNANLIGAVTSTGLQGVSACEYWGLKRQSSTDVNVTLSWMPKSVCNPTNYVINLSAVVAAMSSNGTPLSHPSGQWNFHGGTATGFAASGTVTWASPAPVGANYKSAALAGYQAYTPFTLGTTNWQQAPLPFKILDFHVKPKANQSNIQWLVNDETTVNSYVIERSVDGINFQAILNAASRYSSITASYQRYDENPANGWNYYRLKVINQEGKVQYSSIQKVWFGSAMQITISPNPASSVLNVYLPEPGKVLGISIFNATGQRMHEIRNVRTNEAVDVSAYPTGQYILRVLGVEGVKAYSFVKQ